MPLALIQQALIAILFIAFGSCWAQTGGSLQPVPALTGAVIDQTGTLSAAQSQALADKLAALETKRGSQLVVLMVASTQPESAAD